MLKISILKGFFYGFRSQNQLAKNGGQKLAF